ncbi:hypothetical protein HDU96_009351 [Phlyctochytrium bullatum]|nr:hypothetical protein HDU96_009351 [Phlyctochytrium bullatum]
MMWPTSTIPALLTAADDALTVQCTSQTCFTAGTSYAARAATACPSTYVIASPGDKTVGFGLDALVGNRQETNTKSAMCFKNTNPALGVQWCPTVIAAAVFALKTSPQTVASDAFGAVLCSDCMRRYVTDPAGSKALALAWPAAVPVLLNNPNTVPAVCGADFVSSGTVADSPQALKDAVLGKSTGTATVGVIPSIAAPSAAPTAGVSATPKPAAVTTDVAVSSSAAPASSSPAAAAPASTTPKSSGSRVEQGALALSVLSVAFALLL